MENTTEYYEKLNKLMREIQSKSKSNEEEEEKLMIRLGIFPKPIKNICKRHKKTIRND